MPFPRINRAAIALFLSAERAVGVVAVPLAPTISGALARSFPLSARCASPRAREARKRAQNEGEKDGEPSCGLKSLAAATRPLVVARAFSTLRARWCQDGNYEFLKAVARNAEARLSGKTLRYTESREKKRFTEVRSSRLRVRDFFSRAPENFFSRRKRHSAAVFLCWNYPESFSYLNYTQST